MRKKCYQSQTGKFGEWINVLRLSINGLGRANQLLYPRDILKNQKGSCLMRLDRENVQVMSIECIHGVRDDTGKAKWVGFYGPVWTCRANKDLFEVYEFNAREHYSQREWWSVDECVIPCWIRHLHRFPEGDVEDVCHQISEQLHTDTVYDHCVFDFICDHELKEENAYCPECLQQLTRGRHSIGTDGYDYPTVMFCQDICTNVSEH